MKKPPLLLTILLIATLAASTGARGESLFAISEIPSPGRTVEARYVDLDGDGRLDIFVAVLISIPPEEQRSFRVYLQREDGSFPSEPSHTLAIPRWSAVYDVADLIPESPGAELVLLQPEGVMLMSLRDETGRSWFYPVPGPTTAGLADDERGFEPFQLVYRDFGDEPWILVPQIGQLTAISPRGMVRAALSIPRRANYLILPRTGLVALETDFQIFLDVPKLSVGDVNGDGRSDIVSSTRHEIRVFLQRRDGSFPFEPDRLLPLRLVTPRDHIRGSGGVSSEIRDINGDKRLDLLISQVRGGFSDAKTTIYLHLNHNGGWNLQKPDQTLTRKASLGSNALYDVDQNGLRELLRLEFQFSLFEVVELLMTREIDIEMSIRRYVAGKGFEKKPWMTRKLSLPFSFDTFRLSGFTPVPNVDVNSDGYLDFVTSGGGRAIEVFLGGEDGAFSRDGGRQSMNSAGVIHFDDFDGDGLRDFILHDPHHFDAPIQIGRNLGALPGTPERILPGK